jgi:hypothetical protein
MQLVARYRPNPEWADELIRRHYDAMLATVGDELMPLPGQQPAPRRGYWSNPSGGEFVEMGGGFQGPQFVTESRAEREYQAQAAEYQAKVRREDERLGREAAADSARHRREKEVVEYLAAGGHPSGMSPSLQRIHERLVDEAEVRARAAQIGAGPSPGLPWYGTTHAARKSGKLFGPSGSRSKPPWERGHSAATPPAPPIQAHDARPTHWEPLGPCGSFGCVYGTGTAGTVLKITVDGSEAAFVTNAIAIGEWPDGIVQYTKAFEFPDVKNVSLPYMEGRRRAKRAFCLWREEMKPESASLPYKLEEVSHTARDYYESFQKKAAKDVEAIVAAISSDERLARGLLRKYGALYNAPIAERASLQMPAMSMMLAGIEAALKQIACSGDPSLQPQIADAMLFYMANGMLLADVRGVNTGTVQRIDGPMLVISDPGLMTPLRVDMTSVGMQFLPTPGAKVKRKAWPWHHYDD